MRLPLLISLPALCLTLAAGDVPAATMARFVKIISSGKVACKDSTMAEELGKVGVTVDSSSSFAWASSESEVKSLKAAGKCVICGNLSWLASGGTVAIVEEGGKPQMYIHSGNLGASGVALPDAVMKVSKRQ
jgi:hypothetical protein